MKLRMLTAGLIAAALTLTGCVDDSSSGASPDGSEGRRIKFVINGTLGDKSFFDSANAGLERVRDELGYELDVVELGSDRSKWQPGFEDAAAGGDYDILVAGTFDAVDTISALAPQYPEKKFWLFDAPADYEGANGGCSNACENVYSVTFKQNEGGYLAGTIAAEAVAAKSLPGMEDRTKVGVMGAAEIPVIDDFLVGFRAGFEDAGGSPSDVISQYVGGNVPFADPARAKEIANSMYGQGAALVWPVAGSSGFGVFESAVDNDGYTIGIDSDQFQTLTNDAQRESVMTSILKNVGAALYDAATKDADGTLGYGEISSLGLAEDAVGFVDNERFRELLPADARQRLAEVVAQLAAGEIDVPSAL